MADDQDDLMVVAAWMYYDGNLTHEQIAKELNLSRVKVTRLLQKARDEGVIQFKLTRPMPMQFELEKALQKKFGLARAVVARTLTSTEGTLEEMGQRGADYLGQVLFDGCRLGVGWSTTVSHIAHYFEPPRQLTRCVVSELVGGYPGHNNPYSISMQIARKLGAPLEALPVPAFVQSQEARDTILRENLIRTVLEHASQCEVALVGLGDVSPDGTMVQTGFVTAAEMAELRRQGAVGDTLGRFYDRDGRRVHSTLDERCIAIPWDSFVKIPHIIAMAMGARKIESILGAIRGGFCHSLVTDTATAQALVNDTRP